MPTVISVENLSKIYRLGQIGTGTFSHDLNVWWAKLRGKPNPLLRIGETDHGNRDGEELWALRDVSFTVQQGEVLGIIGRNGAGKSTLLKILSRVTAPTSGRIRVKGRIASLLEVGTGFHPELTGRENIYLNGAILGMKRDEITRKFDEIVDFAGVEKFIDTPVKRYSSGMYVRLAFAVAAHLEPEILVVDEVLAVGDAEFQKKCLGKMGEVADEGRTVLFVSHNMAAVESLCSRAILLDSGTINASGLTKSVILHYLNQARAKPQKQGFDQQTTRESLQFEDIEILWDGDKPTESLHVGDRVDVNVRVRINNPCMNIFLGVTLLDDWNNIVFAFHTQEIGLLIDKEVDKELLVKLEIPHLLLLPGTYHFRLVAVNGLGKTLQEIPRAASVHVYPRDVAQSGHAFTKGHGIMIMPFRMRIVSGNGHQWSRSVLLDGWDSLPII